VRKTCLEMVHELAREDERVVFVGSDLGPGVLQGMKDEMPERFFMEGVSEQHLIGMAAGLAMEGYVPYVNTIATFLTRRCFEQLAVDLCLHDLSVRLIGNGGGLVYAPLGPTHQAIEDLAILRALPNMTAVAPCDADEMRRLMRASLPLHGPLYIRLGKGGDPVVSEERHGFTIGRAIELRRPQEPVTLISTGVMTQRALAVADDLAGRGIGCGVLHFHTLKPLDGEAVLGAAARSRLLVTLEEHTRIGGLGSAVGDVLLDVAPPRMPRLVRLGLPDAFPHDYGRQEDLLEVMGLGHEALLGAILSALEPVPA